MVKPISDIAKMTTRPAANTGGFPCPKCGTRIELTIESLLVRRSFTCTNPKCRTTLTLDEKASKDALTAIKTIKAKTVEQSVRRRSFR